MMSANRKFTFVYIPADTTCPVEEWTEEYTPGNEVECLLDRLKHHFRTSHPSVTDSERQRHKQTLLQTKGMEGHQGISDDLLNLATSMQLVESVALLPCIPQNDYVGVTMYVDDSGSYKNLAINNRATEITQTCGMLSQCIMGDAFIARVRENDEEFERMNFEAAELSSSLKWVKQAQQHNEKKLSQPMAEDLLSQMNSNTETKPATSAEDGREKGNKFFKEGKLKEALECYTASLSFDQKSVPVLSNRSLVYFKLGRLEDALKDAEEAVQIDSTWVKGWYRKGEALEGLDRLAESFEAFKQVLTLQPSNTQALSKLKSLKTQLQGQQTTCKLSCCGNVIRTEPA